MAKKTVHESGSSDAPAIGSLGDAAGASTEIQCELKRILGSPEFSASERGRTLLSYLVENALNGGLERLKERTIGIEIFGREADYDTGQDAIVRVSAASVRKRLSAYYTRIQATGVGSRVRVYLAPGSYVPEFQLAPAAPPVAPGPPPPPPAQVRRVTARKVWILSVLAGALAVVSALLGIEDLRLRSAITPKVPIGVLPWSTIARQPDARIVLTDANFTLHKYIVRRELTLPEYTSQEWLRELKAKQPDVLPLTGIQYTSVASAVTAVKLGSLLERAGCTALVQSARNLQVRDFKEDRPIILLGSAPSNPWSMLFADRLNFFIGIEQGVQVLRNKSPQPGEQALYFPAVEAQSAGVSFAVISLMPNLANKGQVLLIAGTNAEATEAAGELSSDIPRLTEELRKCGIDPAGTARQLELLIRVHCLNQSPSHSEVIAHRITH